MAENKMNIYEDQENRVPGVRGKREGLKVSNTNGQGNPPRTAFGVISVNQHINSNIRKQPSRSAKQGVCYDGGIPKLYQDENAFARQKTISASSGQSLSIYSDETGENIRIDSLQSSANSSNASSEFSRISSGSDRSTLQYAANRLEHIAIPDSIAALPRYGPFTNSGNEAMDMDEESSMSVCTPSKQQQEHLLKLREEQMWDMTEYAADIYAYLREAEKIHRPRTNYMHKQTDITVSMRWILVDWMVEVAEEYNLSTETLYLAVSYIDRFLSHMSVKRDKLQLVGTTAMFIAAKYEEIYPPDVGQFAYITDSTYKVAHILRMEHLILKVLSFDMAVPTAFAFITKFSRTLGCTETTTSLALFIAELTMLDCDPFLRFLPSEIACSALAIANFTQGHTAWPSVMVVTYTYTLEDLRECYVNLNRAYSKVHESTQHSIREKYKSPKFQGVSNIKARADLPF